jgi:endonuclease/exonuclease/phosphatase family metal-dependent hydrolase
MRSLFFLLVFLNSLVAATSFHVVSYNVQNLFDLHHSGNEYKEYTPHGNYGWDQKSLSTKLSNLATIIQESDSEIIALQEIESYQALYALQTTLKRKGFNYPYSAISQHPSTVKTALLSKFPIITQRDLRVDHNNPSFRAILETTLDIHGHPFTIFHNHWKSKSGPESKRILYAKRLVKRLKTMQHEEYILVGDFNSNYNEYATFRKNKKHNNPKGQTGINDIVKTRFERKQVLPKNIRQQPLLHFDPWVELPKKERFSYLFRGKHETLDHILLPATLFDKKKIEYKRKSFHAIKTEKTMIKKRINRWLISRKNPKKHLNKGFSDHLPIKATFVIK